MELDGVRGSFLYGAKPSVQVVCVRTTNMPLASSVLVFVTKFHPYEASTRTDTYTHVRTQVYRRARAHTHTYRGTGARAHTHAHIHTQVPFMSKLRLGRRLTVLLSTLDGAGNRPCVGVGVGVGVVVGG